MVSCASSPKSGSYPQSREPNFGKAFSIDADEPAPKLDLRFNFCLFKNLITLVLKALNYVNQALIL